MNIPSVTPKSYQSDSVNQLTALSWLLGQSKATPDKASLIQKFSQEFSIQEFELGEEVISRPSLATAKNEPKLSSQYFCFIVAGRARALSYDREKQRETSIGLIKEGEFFGGESLWCQIILPYRIVAASKVQVALISLDKLTPYMSKFPELERQWQYAVQQQQKLIFLKTLTQLRYLSSHRLKTLLPYFVANKINRENIYKYTLMISNILPFFLFFYK